MSMSTGIVFSLKCYYNIMHDKSKMGHLVRSAPDLDVREKIKHQPEARYIGSDAE
jgi:hypothetical protein